MGAVSERPFFARCAESPGEKCTHDIHIPLPESMHDDVVTIARLCGKSKADWVRSLIARELYGQLDAVKRKVAGKPTFGEWDERGL
jgi:hypothetical protein